MSQLSNPCELQNHSEFNPIVLSESENDYNSSNKTPVPSESNSSVTLAGRRVLKKQRQPKSWIWSHFSKDQETGIKTCLHCLENNKTTSYPQTTGNSTAALRLKKVHQIAKPISDSNLHVVGHPSQTTLSNMIELIPHNVLDDSTKATMLKALVEFVVDNKEPFELVERNHFSYFVNRSTSILSCQLVAR